MELNDVNEKHKENYLDSYFEDLNISSQEPDRSVMIIRAMEFHDFTDCKSLLEMMEDSKFVFTYKHELERKFEEMLTWFITVKLVINTLRPIPPHAADNKSVDLLGLYMIVERDGGYRSVTDNNMWPVIAKDMGYEYHDGEFMRIIYAMYLNVLVYYYRFKSVQEKVIDKEMIKEGESSSAGCHERSTSADAVQDEAYEGNDWEGAWKMHKKRRRFDFKQAMKAVDEANWSVLMFAAKHNQF
ncbi:putative transcription factor & chromatin remodeling ARID family [Helianthus annuus]|nr:putative transcription factor & chromatin remodeling ARID family [Helianthus annuus]KAJ0515912.1 putative transcription factor & chromatin remodeling ARID family [Helianthus annuus]KAJ0683932.1 putative transcription factor & chromatin remodeling ARID family [Helianthus annuus]KAJ0687887.1 putative transcription factor & chromatin remodeling ARID family [Helianthus annuus]